MSVDLEAILGEAFFELHRDLPREGPGDDASTLRALGMCTELPERPEILDIGCGPGMQTLALAGATDTHGGTLDNGCRRRTVNGTKAQGEKLQKAFPPRSRAEKHNREFPVR